MPNKFIENLSEKDYAKLVKNHQSAESFRVRNRWHAILLSSQRKSIDEIAAICGVHRNAVSRWVNRWNEKGLDGLADAQQTGRPPILTLEEQARSVEIALENPQFPHRQLQRIKEETGKEISSWTLKRVLKKRLSVEEN